MNFQIQFPMRNPTFMIRPFRFVAHAATMFALLASAAVRADENNFGYAYGTEVLPKGHSEVYQWVTYRSGKADGSYRALDLQTEFEHGFTERLQGSLYINSIQHHVSGVTDFTDRSQFRFNGIQGSLKYSLSSPYTDSVGVALYVEPGYKRYSRKSGEREDIYFFESKLLLQKNAMEGALVWVANLTAELEREHAIDEEEWETELELQFSGGVSYRIAPRWFIGAETLVTSAFEAAHLDELGEYAVFAGPNVHYASSRWWATLAVMPQLTGWPENSGSRNLVNFEEVELRLKVGINF